jgi:hypothetical protein
MIVLGNDFLFKAAIESTFTFAKIFLLKTLLCTMDHKTTNSNNILT